MVSKLCRNFASDENLKSTQTEVKGAMLTIRVHGVRTYYTTVLI